MKKTATIILILAAAVSTGCKGFLDVTPTNNVSADEVVSSPAGIQAFLANLYYRMPIEAFDFTCESKPCQDQGYRDGFHFNDGAPNNSGRYTWVLTDDCMGSELCEIPGDNCYLWWDTAFELLHDLNEFTALIPGLNSVDETTRTELEGQSWFIRGQIYFALARRYGGLPIITSLTDGYYLVPYITSSYRAGGSTVSQPLNFFAKAGNVFTINTEKVKQRFNMGAEYRYESNKARGFSNDDNFLPLRPNSNGRPRPYFDIPALSQVSAYLEDNLTWELPLKMEFKLQGGVRFDMMQPGLPEQVSAFSPRFNGSLKVTEWLSIRGGWGQSNKTPGLAHLYPEPKYTDREAASYLPSDVSRQLVVYNTKVTEVERNNSLKNATNSKSEIGVDLHFKNGMTFSVVGYQDYLKSGFGNLTEYSVYYANYYTATQGIRQDADGMPYIEWNNPARVDTVFTTSGRIGNTQASLNRGVEFDFNLGQIKAIRTSVLLSGAYMETQTWTTGPNYASPAGIPASSVYAQGGSNTPPFKLQYPSGVSRDIDRRFSANLRLVCNIPRMKMVASLANQVIFYQYRHTTNQKSDPFAWIDTDLSVHDITQAMLNDPDYRIKGILLSAQRRNPADSQPVTQPPIWLMNMRLTKDVSKNFGFSFYVNNAFFHMPYQSSSASGTLTERNTGTFSFGVEMYVKI